MDDGGGAGLAIDEHSMGASTDSDNDSKIRRSSISSNRSRSRTNSRRALRRRAAAGVGTMHVPASERVEQLGETLLHRCIDQVMQPIKRVSGQTICAMCELLPTNLCYTYRKTSLNGLSYLENSVNLGRF